MNNNIKSSRTITMVYFICPYCATPSWVSTGRGIPSHYDMTTRQVVVHESSYAFNIVAWSCKCHQPLIDDFRYWTPDHVARWACDFIDRATAELFQFNCIWGIDLFDMTPEDLMSMALDDATIKRSMAAITELQDKLIRPVAENIYLSSKNKDQDPVTFWLSARLYLSKFKPYMVQNR